MATAWLILAALVGPLVALPPEWGVGLAQAKNAGFILFGFGLLLWLVRNWWVRLFCGLALVSFVASGMRAWGLSGLLGLFAWVMVFHHASRLTLVGWRAVRCALVGATVVQLAWMLVQVAGADPVFRPLSHAGDILPGSPPVTGWFSNRSDTALFLGLSAPAVAAASSWWLLPLGLAIVGLRSTAGFVCWAITACWVATRRSLRWGLVALVLVLVFAGLGWFPRIDTQGIGFRPTIWQHAARIATEHPWIGWGPNALDYRVLIILGNERWNFLFNEWLQGFLELGVGAPGLALGYLTSLGWRLRRCGRALLEDEAVSGTVCVLATSLFSIPLRIGPTAFLAALYLGRLDGSASS